MSNLTMEDFEGGRAWAEKWVRFDRAYSIGNPEMEVNFLGAEDANGDIVKVRKIKIIIC